MVSLLARIKMKDCIEYLRKNSSKIFNKAILFPSIIAFDNLLLIVWFILLFSIYHYHQDLSRRNGYLDFYRQTRNLRRTPLIVISAGNAILVALIKLLEDYQTSIAPLQPWHCLAILTTIEVIIILTVLVWYLGKNKYFIFLNLISNIFLF